MIDYEKLTNLIDIKQVELVKYIYQQQGDRLQRLDYNAAATALSVSRRTVARIVDELGKVGIINFKSDKLKLSETIITRTNDANNSSTEEGEPHGYTVL